MGYFRSAYDEANPGEDWPAAPTNVLAYTQLEDFTGTAKGGAPNTVLG